MSHAHRSCYPFAFNSQEATTYPRFDSSGLRGNDVNFTELDALGAHYVFTNSVDLLHPAAKDYDFQAVVLAQVNVQRSDSMQNVRMLDLYQFLRHAGGMVVVDEKHGRHSLRLRVAKLLGAKLPAHQIAYRLGSALIALLLDELIEL